MSPKQTPKTEIEALRREIREHDRRYYLLDSPIISDTEYDLLLNQLKTRVPVSLGVITPNTTAQALARTKGGMDRGREAAEAALAMIALKGKIRGS